MKTQKVALKLKDGEAAVVAPAKDLIDIANLFKFLSMLEEAYSEEERKVWAEYSTIFREWVLSTEVDLEEEY